MNDQAQILREMMFSHKTEESPSKGKMRVITVASGKGGVGKSNFSVNLALSLQEQSNKPIILDADFGLANVEIILGERPKYNLSHLIKGECEMKTLLTKSKYGISFISGGSGIKDMMFLPPKEIDMISKNLGELEELTDLLIIDTGAGINDVVVKFCMLAEEVYIVVTPEPTSITDSYALMKTLLAQPNIKTEIKVVVNKAISKEEAQQVFNKLAYVVENFLGASIGYVGFVPYDEKVFHAVKEQVPLYIYDKKAKASMAYAQIAKSISRQDTVEETEKGSWMRRIKKIFNN